MERYCEKIRLLILESVSSILPVEKTAELEEHIERCSSCREYLRAVQADDELLSKFTQAMQPRVSRLESNVLGQVRRGIPARPRHNYLIERVIEHKKVAELVAATTIVLAVSVYLYYFSSSVSRAAVAWAAVAEQVQKTSTFRCRYLAWIKGPTGTIEVESTVSNSLEYGIRQDSHVDRGPAFILFVPPTENVTTRIWTQDKKYVHTRLTDEKLEHIRWQLDLRTMVKAFTALEYEELASRTIDGVEVEGIQIDDRRFGQGAFERVTGRLWADMKAGLPVRFEIEGLSEDGLTETKIVADEFEWDVESHAGFFEPSIPDDYSEMADVGTSDVAADIEVLIGGLRMFAELTGGGYPSSLAVTTGVKETFEAYRRQFPRAPDVAPDAAEQENAALMQAACTIYAGLVKDGLDVAYYGQTVTVEFAEAVLVRWKLAQDQYQVIFADLSSEVVSPEQLAQLESRPLNTATAAIKPRPADGGMAGAVRALQLSWMPGIQAVGHEVYFGTKPDELTLLAEVSQPTCDQLPALETDSTYYWRVDEIQPDGSVLAGQLWSFSTGKLLGWWRFDQGAGNVAVDSGPAKNDGTLNNTEQGSWVQGISGHALDFDGVDDSVKTTVEIDQTGSTSVTMMAWVYPTSISPGRHQVISSDDGWWDWSLLREADRWHAFTGDGSWNSQFAVDPNQWQHLAVVFKPDQDVIFYKNAVANSRGFAPITDAGSNAIAIGNNPGLWDEFFQGVIDEVRIYSYALSSEQIEAVYQSTRPPEETQNTAEQL
jgi:hypothetical protein